MNEIGANYKWTAAVVTGDGGPKLHVPEDSVSKGSVAWSSVEITLSGQDVPRQVKVQWRRAVLK